MATQTAHTIGGRSGRIVLQAYVAFVAVFLLAPIVAITAGSLTTTQYVVFPPKGITLDWYLKMFDRPEMLASLVLSLAIAAAAATIASILGLAVGLVLVRHPSPLNRLLW